MKLLISINCQWTVKLLLCLLIFFFSNCSSLQKLDKIGVSQPRLRVVVSSNNVALFLTRMQELNIKPINVDQHFIVNQAGSEIEFWLSFQFPTPNEMLTSRSAILSTGLVSRIRR